MAFPSPSEGDTILTPHHHHHHQNEPSVFSFNQDEKKERDLLESPHKQSCLEQHSQHWSPRARGVLLLNILAFFYGSNIPVIKEAERLVDPIVFLVCRFALAAIVFCPFVWCERKNEEVISAGIELGLWISVGYLTQGVGLLTTAAGRASFISAFTVIIVPILAVFSRVKISKQTWGAAGAALLGIGLLESTGSPTIGDFWSLVSAILFGIHMLRTEHYSRALPHEKSLSLVGVELFVVTMCSVTWSWFSKISVDGFYLQSISSEELLQRFTSLPWLAVLYTGLISTAICLWIEVSAMRDVSATDTAIIYSLEPLWGAAFAWCLLGERWGTQCWLGALLILGGSISVQLSSHAPEVASCSSKDTFLKLKSIGQSVSIRNAPEKTDFRGASELFK